MVPRDLPCYTAPSGLMQATQRRNACARRVSQAADVPKSASLRLCHRRRLVRAHCWPTSPNTLFVPSLSRPPCRGLVQRTSAGEAEVSGSSRHLTHRSATYVGAYKLSCSSGGVVTPDL